VRENVTDYGINWAGGKNFAMLKGKQVRLMFELSAAKLYAFSGLELRASP
jgi:hypothetical protein